MSSYRSGYGTISDIQDPSKDFAREYRKMLVKIDPWEVLNRYGARNITEIDTKRGLQLQHSCIIDSVDPHHVHGDENPSATMHAGQKLYNCYSYGGGDLFWLIQKMEGVDRAGVLPILSQLLGTSVQTSKQFLEEIDRYFVKEQRVISIPQYSEKILEPWLLIHPYMTDVRKISEEVLMAHKVGYDEKDARIVLPHFWNEKLVGWQKRRLDDPRWPTTPDEWDERQQRWIHPPKYQNSYSFPKLETLYSTSQTSTEGGTSVLVVESVLSILRAETLVTSSRSQFGEGLARATSTFGAKVSGTQLKLLRSFDKVTTWFDDDIAGLRATVKVANSLSKFTNMWVVQNQGERDDLAGLTESEIEDSLESAEPAMLVLPAIEARLHDMEVELKKKRERERQERGYS